MAMTVKELKAAIKDLPDSGLSPEELLLPAQSEASSENDIISAEQFVAGMYVTAVNDLSRVLPEDIIDLLRHQDPHDLITPEHEFKNVDELHGFVVNMGLFLKKKAEVRGL